MIDDVVETEKICAGNSFELLLNRWNRRFSNNIYRMPIFREKNYFFNKEFNLISEPVYLEGYWQSPRYFEDIRELINNEIQLRSGLPAKCRNISEEIELKNSICIHIRRGDYISNKRANKLHSVCSIDYYAEAIRIISQKVQNPTYYVFSDDMEWAKESFLHKLEVRFVELNNGSEPHLDLILMSKCKYFIIANSTFSWWAAWLNNCQDKIVVSPRNWFRNESLETKDLIPHDWIKI